MLLLPGNRNWRAWTILIPVVIFESLLWMIGLVTLFNDSGGMYKLSLFGTAGAALVSGLASLWLLSDRLPSGRPLRAAGLAMAWMLLFGCIGFLIGGVKLWSEDTISYWLAYAGAALCLVCAILLESYLLVRQLTFDRLLFGSAVTTMVLSVLLGLLTQGVLFFTPLDANSIHLPFGYVEGLIYTLFAAPFLFLCFANAHYQARYQALFPRDAAQTH